ncbi:MAG: hypothetical protein HOM34_01380 [Planctomycetes bacterium]|jgi:endoglucanase|nr:hypothetical protein [Planctomycetota bacterium]MBT4029326.1 hypothetical protein [Planctomycetota bacterium]MBT4560811.1 hypothetical protein [Planctomycetota bacterium]MBT5101446.1 hypothetical protein [Planctomycetota bacterium]MBT5119353.1 hypothetical protein [Planctomycetota bacterium]
MVHAWNLPRGARGKRFFDATLRPVAESAIRQIMTPPTAPYAEALPAAAIQEWAKERGWKVRKDGFGNLIVRVPGKKRGQAAMAFVAHLDHPAMTLDAGADDAGRVVASFFGGHPGERMMGCTVALYSACGTQKAKAVVVKVGEKSMKTGRLELVLELKGKRKPAVAAGWIGAWDLPLRLTKKHVKNVVCDNLASAACILAGLDLAARNKPEHPIEAWFTRCEENGFVGCLEGIRLGSFSKKVPAIVLECSPKLPHAQPGDGPCVRVGDRLSIYDPLTIDLLEGSAAFLKEKIEGFKWQRKLMDGGACEATAFCRTGYRSAGLAMPLTNYHNVPDDRKKTTGVAHEQIDRGDFDHLVLWVATLALGSKVKTPDDPAGVAARLEKMRKARVGLGR